MRIAIVGAGGVGGYFGGRLLAAGHDVVFFARGEHGAALRERGLVVRSPLGDLALAPIRVAQAGETIGAVDLVLVAVKSGDTASAVAEARRLAGPRTVALSLQNGVEKDEILQAALGPERVLGGVTYILATIATPGVIEHAGRMQRILLGELAGGRSSRTDELAAAFVAAGIDAQAVDDVRRATWEKLIFLAANAGVTTVTRRTLGEVRTHPATRALLADLMHEAVAVARAEGVAIGDGFVDDRLRFTDTLPADGRASMAHDLLRGRPLELEWLSGALVRRAARLGVDVPSHRAIYAALVLDAGGAAPAA